MKHKHDWHVIAQNATGYKEKQEGQQHIIAVRGTVFECLGCPKVILEPTDLKLRTAEIER